MRTHRALALPSLTVLALCSALALTACGGGGAPSIRAEPDTTTSTTGPEPTTTTTPSTSTTIVVADGQIVRYRGLQLVVPAAWPVHDLAADPHTCVRADVHAVYLGTPGPDQDCPARALGHTGTVLIMPVQTASQTALARATQAAMLNGMAVRMDPDPDAAGALTVVFPDLGLVAFVTYGESSTLAHQILSGFALVSS